MDDIDKAIEACDRFLKIAELCKQATNNIEEVKKIVDNEAKKINHETFEKMELEKRGIPDKEHTRSQEEVDFVNSPNFENFK